MARMIPATYSGPRSERIVFEALERYLPKDWVVIHARRFVLPQKWGPAAEGELDFLVLDPARGYVVFEVKGGSEIGRDENGWYSVSHGSSTKNSIKDPGAQAQNAVHRIDDYLRDHWRPGAGQKRPSFAHGVIFPDFAVKGTLDPALPREIVIDSDDLRHADAAIDALFVRVGVTGPPLDSASVRSFIDTLAPRFRLVRPLANRIQADEAALLRLTEDQARIVEQLGEVPRVLVEGPAGSGKTILAMQRARDLSAKGLRVLLLCYNRALADHLTRCAEGFDVNSYHTLCSEMARAAGLPWHPPRKDWAGRFWTEEAPDLLERALATLPDHRWDALVVDEGQDFAELWWMSLEKLLREPTKGSIWVFLDPNQNIYQGAPTEVIPLTKAKLTFNCRNTRRIARFSADIRGIEVRTPDGAPEGTEVTQIDCDTDEEMCEAVRKTLHHLIHDEKLTTDQVKILSPRAPANSIVFQKGRLGNYTLKEFPGVMLPNQVGFATLQRFKGLDSDAVILCEVDTHDSLTCSPSHLYVGTTRAKHHLTMIRHR